MLATSLQAVCSICVCQKPYVTSRRRHWMPSTKRCVKTCPSELGSPTIAQLAKVNLISVSNRPVRSAEASSIYERNARRTGSLVARRGCDCLCCCHLGRRRSDCLAVQLAGLATSQAVLMSHFMSRKQFEGSTVASCPALPPAAPCRLPKRLTHKSTA